MEMTAELAAPARILMVDDDPGIRDVVSDFLGMHGYNVATAGEAREMERALARLQAQCRVVLDDGHDMADPRDGSPDEAAAARMPQFVHPTRAAYRRDIAKALAGQGLWPQALAEMDHLDQLAGQGRHHVAVGQQQPVVPRLRQQVDQDHG